MKEKESDQSEPTHPSHKLSLHYLIGYLQKTETDKLVLCVNGSDGIERRRLECE